LVLHRTVCTECNDYFGRVLDRGLARESWEGLERYQWKTKPPEELGKFRYTRVRLIADVPGDFHGCLLTLKEDKHSTGGVKAVPLPQVGFARTNGSGFTYFSLSEFEAGVWRDDPSVDPTKGVKIIEADYENVKSVLEQFGVRLKVWRSLERPNGDTTLAIDQMVRYTDEHLRAIAKIAFNYLAYIHGGEFVLRQGFDSTRRYIRYGKQPFLPAVHISDQEIYRPPAAAGVNERAVAHILTIARPLNAEVVLGQVTLYNWIRYDVVLSYTIPLGIQEAGHLFSPKTLTVHRLGKRQTANKENLERRG
jgi:hypothetical protein